MKRVNQIIMVLLILLFAASNSFASRKEVTAKINEYLTAVQNKDAKTIENLVSDDTKFVMLNKIVNKEDILNEDEFVKFVKDGRAGAWVTSNKVKFVDQRDDLAIALIESDGTKLVRKEYLTLLITNGKWQIISSASSLSKK